MMPRALLVSGLIATALAVGSAQEAAFRVGEVLPAWSPGTLDIHQIVTGRGNAAFARFPDGTTMLIDAGGAGETPYAAPRPDATRTPGEWIARYVRHMMNAEAARIDYAVLTHFHPDHMGAVAQVADAVPIRRLVDRGWPAYDYLAPPGDQLFDSYRQFVAARLDADKAQPWQPATQNWSGRTAMWKCLAIPARPTSSGRRARRCPVRATTASRRMTGHAPPRATATTVRPWTAIRFRMEP